MWALKSSIELDPSGRIWATWAGQPPCRLGSQPWVGVTCEKVNESGPEERQAVVAVDLDELGGVVGTIPPE
eukprot:6966746-Pyramimonas_sp.AAC.2